MAPPEAVSYVTGAGQGPLMLTCDGRREDDRRAVMDGCGMGDHEIMRRMAVDYRRAAEGAADPERRGRDGPQHAGAKPPPKPAL